LRVFGVKFSIIFSLLLLFFELEIDKEFFASKCGTKLGINCHYYNYISKAARVITDIEVYNARGL